MLHFIAAACIPVLYAFFRLAALRSPLGFGSLAQVEGYGIITQVALGFIAFVIGNEFRLSALKRMGRQAVTVGIAQPVFCTFGLFWLFFVEMPRNH